MSLPAAAKRSQVSSFQLNISPFSVCALEGKLCSPRRAAISGISLVIQRTNVRGNLSTLCKQQLHGVERASVSKHFGQTAPPLFPEKYTYVRLQLFLVPREDYGSEERRNSRWDNLCYKPQADARWGREGSTPVPRWQAPSPLPRAPPAGPFPAPLRLPACCRPRFSVPAPLSPNRSTYSRSSAPGGRARSRWGRRRRRCRRAAATRTRRRRPPPSSPAPEESGAWGAAGERGSRGPPPAGRPPSLPQAPHSPGGAGPAAGPPPPPWRRPGGPQRRSKSPPFNCRPRRPHATSAGRRRSAANERGADPFSPPLSPSPE